MKNVRLRLAAICGALFIVLVVVGTARLSGAGEPDPASPHQSIEAPDMNAEVCTEPPAAAEPGVGYECPDGVPYCMSASQCTDYCGPGFETCSFGCCLCAG